MNIFEMLARESHARGLPCFVIGGHAVNAYGFSRFTKDLDLLVNREHRAGWLDLLRLQGYSLDHDGGHFLQFKPAADTAWPLDLMLVNADTFTKFSHEAGEIEIGPVRLRVPSLDHLIALKLHVLKQQVAGRGFKDLVDILSLAQANGVDLRSERMKSLCDKFGTSEIYERILAFNG